MSKKHETPFPSYIEESLIKAQRASEISVEIFDICMEHSKSENPSLLDRAGTLLGDFANNLRSALNYTTRAIILCEVIPKLSSSKAKALKNNMDFPCFSSKEKFVDGKSSKIIQDVDLPLYKLFQRFQPFHPENLWLEDLRLISNTDKHIVINKVHEANPDKFLTILPDGSQVSQPWFVENKLVEFTEKGPLKFDLPVYFDPLKSFATTRGNWSMFYIPINDNSSVHLIEFIRNSPRKVIHILASLESLYLDR